MSVLTVEQAEALAERTLAAISEKWEPWLEKGTPWLAADRERVASDLAGLRDHQPALPGKCHVCHDAWPCADVRRYSDGLLRTARLYGVEL